MKYALGIEGIRRSADREIYSAQFRRHLTRRQLLGTKRTGNYCFHAIWEAEIEVAEER